VGCYVSPLLRGDHSLIRRNSGRYLAYGDRRVVRETREKTLRGEVEARPRNWLVPSLLQLLRGWSSYGYELMQRLAALGFEAPNITTIYRALRQMKEKGMISLGWEVLGDGPARRVYSITEAGEAHLESWISSLEQHQRTIETFLQVYEQQEQKASVA
jgi:PadR family transcriptional regulator PadR